MRADEGRNGCSLLAKKTKARTEVGRGKKSLLSDPRVELGVVREKEKEKCEDDGRDEQKYKKKKKVRTAVPVALICIRNLS